MATIEVMPKPYFLRNRATLYLGDVLGVLRDMPSESVHCCVTSPPYWSLRDYGVEGQIGLEATPEEYVARMVEVFREVRRVLRQDATLWLNLGDSYAAAGGGGESRMLELYGNGSERCRGIHSAAGNGQRSGTKGCIYPGLKPKDLVGIPWRVAFALQADGWWLRSDIIWAKPNPMPESVTDRPTKSHEYLFLLAKSERYYYDADAVREPDSGQDHRRTVLAGQPSLAPPGQTAHSGIRTLDGRNGAGRNCRDVWIIPTQPYSEAHFATFPEALVEPCIKAGTSERGVCPVCGAPWRRVVEREYRSKIITTGTEEGRYEQGRNRNVTRMGDGVDVTTTGWQPTCTHDAEPVPAVCLDPFAGSGTTMLVAQKLGRFGVGIELSQEYADIAARRLAQEVLAL